MRIKVSHYLGILTAFAIVLGNAAISLADNETPIVPQSNLQAEVVSVEASDTPIDKVEAPDEEDVLVEEETSDEEDSSNDDDSSDEDEFTDEEIVLPTPDPIKEEEEFLKRLNSELNLSGAEYRQILSNITATQRQLNMVSKQKTTLTDQLNNIDTSVALTTKKLFDVVMQIVQSENEITLIYDQIQVKEIALEYQKNLLKDYLRLLYEQENSFLGTDEEGQVDAIKLLLTDDSVGDNLKELRYFSLLSEAGQQMADKLDKLNQELIVYKEKVKTDRINLQTLKDQLDIEKQSLEQQKQSKENLLKVTSGQEEIYSQLLAQSLREQQEVLGDIKSLDNAVSSIQTKIANGESFDTAEYENFLDDRALALYKFQMENTYTGITQFMWPVEPSRGLTAYFHDPFYRSTFGMQHNAIDIPVLQGSLVRSTSDGVVYKTKDNGYGYSYIIVAHTGGFMSVYGHISSILAKEGDTVKQGSILGLSGGMPGTKGAGYMTTGPHLHFELLANGVYVDPLNYVPIASLSFENIEKLPKEYMEAWKLATSVSREGPIERSTSVKKIPSNVD
ncbi:MAG: peptidoglycan DD-metalloendopeptidase family protein [Candidatus Gracilibacteria bacterium]